MYRATVNLFFILAAIFCAEAFATKVEGMRFWQSPERTRVVLDISQPVKHSVFYLQNPHRMVIDLEKSELEFDSASLEIDSQLVAGVRTSETKGKVRVVLDLTEQAEHRAFALTPYQNYGHRLVIDLLSKNKKAAPPKPKSRPKNTQRDVIVAIDAGHGGEDPGAIGKKGTKEKDIALKLAKQLAKLVNQQKGMKAVLVRTGDYFIGLSRRPQVARKHQADIFVSIHADGYHDRRAKGASVWVVSPEGASSEMGRWLEEREKSSNKLGGVESLSNKDPLLARVLLDLSTTYSVGASLDAADEVRRHMATAVTKMHQNRVQRASFVVLKMPDIPGILVEMGFITNAKEEALLRTSKYRNKIANAVFKGLLDYFEKSPPDGTLFASAKFRESLSKPKTYVIRRGDTLSEIASRYQVSLRQLKSTNKMTSDVVRVGQTLKIP